MKRKNKKRKEVAPQKDLKEIPTPIGLEISYAWKLSQQALISAFVYNSLLIIFFIVIDFNFSNLSNTGAIFKLIFILTSIMGVLLGYEALRTFYNRTYIYIDREKIDTFTKPFRWPREGKSIPVNRITEFDVEKYASAKYVRKSLLGPRYLIAIEHRYAVIYVAKGFEEIGRKEYLVKQIPRYEQAERIKQELQRYLEDAT